MRRKNIGLFLSVTILLSMALFSEKKVLVTTGYAVSRLDIETGREVYLANCHRCHGNGHSGAPSVGDVRAWKLRIGQGMDVLIAHAVEGYRGRMPPRGGNPRLDNRNLAAAVAYMVKESEEP